MKVKIHRIPLMVLGEVMQKMHDTPVHLMTWSHGKITSPTLPSSFMAF